LNTTGLRYPFMLDLVQHGKQKEWAFKLKHCKSRVFVNAQRDKHVARIHKRSRKQAQLFHSYQLSWIVWKDN